MPTLSAILPLYFKNNPAQVKAALDSILAQTRLPDELMVVTDGPVSDEIISLINNKQSAIDSEGLPLKLIFLLQEKNQGLGETLRVAVEKTHCDYVARMDADDICFPERFETQMKCFEEHPEVSVVGGQIVEFDGAETNITGRRRVPLRHEDIAAYMKSRNGLNFHNYPNLDILFEK